MSALKDYSFEIADVARDRERILGLWREGLSHEGRPEAKFDWYYGRNPAGAPLVVYLCHGEARRAVGTASTGRRELQAMGEPVTAGLLLDFVVEAAHRTMFPAMALQREMKRVADETFGTIYGFPNRNSEAAIRRQGFERVGMRVRHVLVLRTSGYLARRMPAAMASLAGPVADTALLAVRAVRGPRIPGLETAWVARPDARFDDLWHRCAGLTEVMGVRDAAFLAWRLADFPFGRHEFFTLSSARAGRLEAYAACREVNGSLHVSDFLADPADSRLLAALWGELGREARSRGCASLSVEFFGDERVAASLAAAGFRARSERPFYVSRASPLAHKRWYVTAADEDA